MMAMPYNRERDSLSSVTAAVPCTQVMHPTASQSTIPSPSVVAVLDSTQLLHLNVGGQSFILREGTIARRAADSRLAALVAAQLHETRLQYVDGFLLSSQEYFFERSPRLFGVIYRYYVSGFLQKPTNVLDEEFVNELIYWQLIETEAARKLFIADNGEYVVNQNGNANRSLSVVSTTLPDDSDEFKNIFYGDLRRKLWNLAEEPSSSTAAQVFAFLSILFVLVSISGLIIGSIPEFQVPVKTSRNSSEKQTAMEPHDAFNYVENVCMVWFTGEYMLKLLVTTQRWDFFRRFLNIIDIMAIVPFYLEMSLYASGINTEDLRDLKAAFLVIRILRVARVIRIFKLGRYSTGLQTFAITLKESIKQLGMMSMVMATGIVFFSSLVYFLEKEEPTSQFYSIPAGFWWCIVTMTTVGYGDVVPITIGGKLVASGAIACGVLVLALPITVIVDNFMKVSGEAAGDQGLHAGKFTIRKRTDTSVAETENRKPTN